MEITGDPTDPRGTKRPLEDPILVSTHVFRPVIVVNRPPKVCLPLHLLSDSHWHTRHIQSYGEGSRCVREENESNAQPVSVDASDTPLQNAKYSVRR